MSIFLPYLPNLSQINGYFFERWLRNQAVASEIVSVLLALL